MINKVQVRAFIGLFLLGFEFVDLQNNGAMATLKATAVFSDSCVAKSVDITYVVAILLIGVSTLISCNSG